MEKPSVLLLGAYLLFINVGCALNKRSGDIPILIYTIEHALLTEASKTVELFNKHCNVESFIPIKIINILDSLDAVAYCVNFDSPIFLRYIELDYEYFYEASDLTRETIMLHELGHCFSSLEHDEELNRYLLPRSLMKETVFSDYFYMTDKSGYIDSVCPRN